MIANRTIAVAYRILAAAIILAGLLTGSGFSEFPRSLLFYTTQSNILSLLFLLYLAARTIIDLIKKGVCGTACYSPRFSMMCVMFVGFTFIVFWCILAPFVTAKRLLSFGNIALHALCPLFMLCDHLLFCEGGHLKKKDVFLCALLPLYYVIFSSILGFCGVIFYYSQGTAYYFPYLFMDFYQIGGLAVVGILIIASVYVLVAWLFVTIDSKWKKPLLYPQKKEDGRS